jgi:hypothetical protein
MKLTYAPAVVATLIPTADVQVPIAGMTASPAGRHHQGSSGKTGSITSGTLCCGSKVRSRPSHLKIASPPQRHLIANVIEATRFTSSGGNS